CASTYCCVRQSCAWPISLLSVHCSRVVPRDLHSFPTRCSSDVDTVPSTVEGDPHPCPRRPQWSIVPLAVCSAAHSGTRSEPRSRSEDHTSELQSRFDLVCRPLLDKKRGDDDPSRPRGYYDNRRQ